jgi:glucose-1-phosphate thymidylyltransferase
MKAIIPVAGAGTKLRPHTYTQPKSLIPIGGKTILGYIIEQLQEVGIDDFVFVIGYLGDKIQDYIEKNHTDIKRSYISQYTREGLGHAIWLTKDIVNADEEVVIILGDTIMELDIQSFLNLKGSALGVKKVVDPRIFGVAEIDSDGNIVKVVEKPTIPKSNMALVGLYKIHRFGKLIEALSYNIDHNIRNNNEFFLTDGLQEMIKRGEKFAPYKIDNWYDCGQKEVLLATNALLLKKRKFLTKSFSPNFENTILVDPVYIGENTVIKNCIIGPNVTIGENTTIQQSIIRNSIIGSYTKMDDVVLYNSLVGSDSMINGSSQSLNIGDNTELDLR